MARYMALLERFPHGLEFQCCEKLSPTSQYAARKVAQEWARKRAEERQIKDSVVVLYVNYYNDLKPRYRTHIGAASTAECIEALELHHKKVIKSGIFK